MSRARPGQFAVWSRRDCMPSASSFRRRRWSRFVGAVALAMSALMGYGAIEPTRALAQDETAPEAESVVDESPAERDRRLVAHCIDGSILRVLLNEDMLPIKTEYGRLEIPVADIERIEFAVRIPENIAAKVDAAVKKLASAENGEREAARAELLALEQMAYPALVDAAGSEDTEVSMSAERLLAEIRELVPEENLHVRQYDLVHTENSQIAGLIQVGSLKVDTVALGPQELKLEVLRQISAATDDHRSGDVLPNPGNLTRFQGQVGKTLRFRVTAPPPGFQQGVVWGTDVYTLDSHLGMAAVHAGVIKPGETKVLTVELFGPQNGFRGSTRNGVTTANWNNHPGAFRFKPIRGRR